MAVTRIITLLRAVLPLAPAAVAPGKEPTMDEVVAAALHRLPFAELLGIRVTVADRDRVVGEMAVRPELCTVPAVAHGGAVMAFADTLGALGTILNLAEGSGTTTVESKTNFMAPAPEGMNLVGEATPLHRGRRTMVWQTRIATGEGRLVAMVIQTQLVLGRGAA